MPNFKFNIYCYSELYLNSNSNQQCHKPIESLTQFINNVNTEINSFVVNEITGIMISSVVMVMVMVMLMLILYIEPVETGLIA